MAVNATSLVDFSYCLSTDLDLDVRIKIQSLEGLRRVVTKHAAVQAAQAAAAAAAASADGDVHVDTLHDAHDIVHDTARHVVEVFLSCQIFAYGRPLAPEVQTQYHSLADDWSSWNEWLVMPVKYRHLPLGAQLALTVWQAHSPRHCTHICGCTMPIFGKSNTLLSGEHKLAMWHGVRADGAVPSSTPAIVRDHTEMDRLERLMRRHERGDISQVQWLDHLAYREIERINKLEKTKGDSNLCLYVFLPKFDFPLVFHETPYWLSPAVRGAQYAGFNTVGMGTMPVSDPEAFQENPVEEKHRKMTRSHRSASFDVTVKPNPKIRDELKSILQYPPTKALTNEEKDLLWKYRFYLTRDKKALTKFLKCVTWTDPIEVNQARDLLFQWADVDVTDALELLGPWFGDSEVRRYAVMQLRRADNDDVLMYLLQLVQALKFEVHRGERADVKHIAKHSDLLSFLINRSVKNPHLGNYFYWYISVERQEPRSKQLYDTIMHRFLSELTKTPNGMVTARNFERQELLVEKLIKACSDVRTSKESRQRKIQCLQSFLSDPANGLKKFDQPLPLPLDPSVQVVGIIPELANIFKSSLQPLFLVFKCVDGSTYPVIFKAGDDLRQDQLVVQLITLMDKLLKRENLDLKLTAYKVLATGPTHGMAEFVPSDSLAGIIAKYGSILAYLKLISNTSVPVGTISSIQQESSTPELGSRSNSQHAESELVTTTTTTTTQHKNEQSLEQDTSEGVQSRQDNIAQSTRTGLDAEDGGGRTSVGTPATAVSMTAPNGTPWNGEEVSGVVLDTYIRSLAGYCVITNLFGVGDRHLDNILLTPAGNLFHVDFGFILGRDPKPFPPPVKLSKEMVDAMGGQGSRGYGQFISYACTAYSSLRKTANLVLNLLGLMVDAPLPDVAADPDKVVGKVQEKYRLDLREEEAMRYFETAVVAESLAAVLPQVMEKIHQVAQLLRS